LCRSADECRRCRHVVLFLGPRPGRPPAACAVRHTCLTVGQGHSLCRSLVGVVARAEAGDVAGRPAQEGLSSWRGGPTPPRSACQVRLSRR